MSKNKKWTIIGLVVVVILAICGGAYYHMSHAVASQVPGHVYRYKGISGNKTMYVTFAQSGDQVIVTGSKDTAVKAAQSTSDFSSVYQSQSADAQWQYKADGNKLTLAKTVDGKTSQWQYNGVLSTSRWFRSSSFTYQIVDAGQGQVKKHTTFTRIK